MCLGLQPHAMRPIGCTIPITFTFTGSWVQEWWQFSVNFLIGVIAFWQIRRLQACTLWPMPQGARRPYENQSASFQGWGQEGCHLTVYYHAGCWDCTLLPYVICPLQGYPGELVRSSGTDVALDGILAILDEHYNNVKALDALNQEFFKMWMGEKETVLEWGCICLGTSKFSQLHSWSTFHWIT